MGQPTSRVLWRAITLGFYLFIFFIFLYCIFSIFIFILFILFFSYFYSAVLLLQNGCGCGTCYWAWGSQPAGCSGGPSPLASISLFFYIFLLYFLIFIFLFFSYFYSAVLLLQNGCGCGTCYWAWGSQPAGCSGGPSQISAPQYSGFAASMETYASKPNIRPAIAVPPESLDYVMVTEGEGKGVGLRS